VAEAAGGWAEWCGLPEGSDRDRTY
jgi:hypothetical protein